MFKSHNEMLFIFSGVMNLVVTATGDLDIKDKITAVSTNVSQEGVHNTFSVKYKRFYRQSNLFVHCKKYSTYHKIQL